MIDWGLRDAQQNEDKGLDIKKYVSDLWEMLNSHDLSELQKKRIQDNVELSSLACAVVCFVMTVLNYVQHSYVMMITTAVLFVFLLVLYLWTHFRPNERLPIILCLAVVMAIFTWYFVSGGQNGFSALWILLVPSFCAIVFGLWYGLICNTYFLALIIVCFWTPVRSNFSAIYTSTFIDRFPMIYIATFLIGNITNILIARYEYGAYKHGVELEEAVKAEHDRVEMMEIQTMITMVNAIEAKDKYTNEHSRRVAAISVEIAKRLGWTHDKMIGLYCAALMHDIGKIGVSDDVLNKQGTLTEDEFRRIKKHTSIGEKILKNITLIEGLSDGTMYHHEKYDGEGYPAGLKGEDIPLIARIICAADSYDAMYSKRVYSPPMDLEYIKHEFETGEGKQFDPVIAEIVIKMINEGDSHCLEDIPGVGAESLQFSGLSGELDPSELAAVEISNLFSDSKAKTPDTQ